MKKSILFFLVVLAASAEAQSLIDSLGNPGFTLQDSVSGKLAELALKNNPNLVFADKQTEANKYEWKKNKASLLNNIMASFNLNEGNLNPPKDQVNLFYPRYNLSLQLPLGTFITKPKETKKAKAIYEASQASKDIAVNSLKEQIKTAYQVYQANKYLLSLQESVLQDESVLLAQAQQKFQSNQLSLELFTNASKRYNAELVKKLNLLRDTNISKIELESLLGMDLETAMKQISAAQ